MLLLATYITVFAACLLFIIVDNPFSLLINISMLLLGVGISGLVVTSYFLLNLYTQDENRGIIVGISVTIGCIG